MNEKEYNKSLLIDKDGYLVLGSLEENEREMIAVIANLKADKIEGEYVEKSKLHSLKLHLKVFVAIFAWNIFGQIYYLTRV